MRYLYSLCFYLMLPFVLLRLLWKSRKAPVYRERIAERFGYFQMPKNFQNGIWVHSVSVGETVAAVPLIKALQKQYPHLPITVTTQTPTGSERVKAAFHQSVFHVYVPYDLPSIVRRFLNKVQPKIVIIMETEIWPNLLHQCHQRKIPIVLANARLSERSAKGYAKLGKGLAKILKNITMVAAQSELDAKRFIDLGMPAQQVQVVGSVKFDVTIPPSVKEGGEILRQQLGSSRPVWIAASTHDGEEELVLKAFKQVKKVLPDCLLLLVPRHPERFSKVTNMCKEAGYQVVLRSQQVPCQAETDIFVGDTMGEMMLFFAASDVAFVAGSLVPVGGHNILEPAAFGLGIITGSHMFNFSKILELFIESDAVKVIHNANELAQETILFLSDVALREQYGDRAKKVIDANRGALQKHLNIIANLLSRKAVK